MPHDRFGKKLHPGDIVAIPCTVKGIDKHSDYINLAVETIEGRHPDGKKETFLINAREVELVKSIGESDPALDVDSVLFPIKAKVESDSCGSMSTIIKKSNEIPKGD